MRDFLQIVNYDKDQLAYALANAIKERDEAREELANLEALMFGGQVHFTPNHRLAWRVFDAAMAMKKERDEAREALENHTASTTHSCHDQCQRPMCVLRRELDKERERAKELAELVDASYIFVELHKPDCEYNKKWRVAWMEKAKRLIPGVDSIWY